MNEQQVAIPQVTHVRASLDAGGITMIPLTPEQEEILYVIDMLLEARGRVVIGLEEKMTPLHTGFIGKVREMNEALDGICITWLQPDGPVVMMLRERWMLKARVTDVLAQELCITTERKG